MFMQLYIGVYSFFVCLVMLPLAIVLAKRFGLTDIPDDRKIHKNPVPVVGGICIFLTLLAAQNVYSYSVFPTIMCWLGLVCIIGLIDDLIDLSHRARLGLHATVVVGLFATENLYVWNIGAILGSSDINILGPIGLLFTVICVLGVVNAINMSDGVDGLLASFLIISFMSLLVLTSGQLVEYSFAFICSWSILGASLAFLLFNSRGIFNRGIVFLGDSGSTTLGFILVYVLIQCSQSPDALINPTLAGWIVGLPLLDASAVIFLRVVSGKSPFIADRSHLHHLMVDHGYSVNHTVKVLAVIHAIMILFGITVDALIIAYADALLFWIFIILVLLRVMVCNWLFHLQSGRITSTNDRGSH